MKFATAYYGIQIIAENSADKKILEKLFNSLPAKAEYFYEEGTVKIVTKETSGTYGFDTEEIKKAKMCIEFLR